MNAQMEVLLKFAAVLVKCEDLFAAGDAASNAGLAGPTRESADPLLQEYYRQYDELRDMVMEFA